MCRFLAVITPAPQSIGAAFSDQIEAFTSQSTVHKDGWGLAWLDENGRVERQRGLDEAHASVAYRSAVFEESVSRASFIHLRKATPGLPLQMTNTHPFLEGSIAFCHNGEFALADGIREDLQTRCRRAPHGTTDSELYFGCVLRYAEELGLTDDSPVADWALALQRGAREVTEVVTAHGHVEPESLNALLLTPRGIAGYEQSDDAQAKPHHSVDNYHLMVEEREDRVVLMSSGAQTPDFRQLGQREAIAVEIENMGVQRLAPVSAANTARV